MKIRFADTREVLIEELSENRNTIGTWTISFTIQGVYSSIELDDLFSQKNISMLTIIGEDNTKVVTGYTRVTKMSIQYSDDMSDAIIRVALQK